MEKSKGSSSMIDRLTYVTVRKTTTADDDNYFNANETRYAQTISFRKRHTPAFQVFTDILIFMFIYVFFCITLVYYYRKWLKLSEIELQTFVWHRNLYLEFVVSFILLAKAVTGCLWCHYVAKGNKISLTSQIYMIRLCFDLLVIIVAVFYYIYSSQTMNLI